VDAKDIDIGNLYLSDAQQSFREYKRLAEGAFSQITAEEWFTSVDEEANSIAAIVKHMAGNMRSRFTDFLTSDGEKPGRDRDQEFVIDSSTTPVELKQWWESGWDCVFRAAESLTPADLNSTIYIRGKAQTVLRAINRQLLHYSYHTGQIVFLAKHFRGNEWKSLTVPKGQSALAGRTIEKALEDRRNS